MRKWVSESDGEPNKRFVIEEEDEVGFYLYVFTGDKCANDYLQDTFDLAVEQAEEDFGVSREAWELVSQSTP